MCTLLKLDCVTQHAGPSRVVKRNTLTFPCKSSSHFQDERSLNGSVLHPTVRGQGAGRILSNDPTPTPPIVHFQPIALSTIKNNVGTEGDVSPFSYGERAVMSHSVMSLQPGVLMGSDMNCCGAKGGERGRERRREGERETEKDRETEGEKEKEKERNGRETERERQRERDEVL